jgi:predicted AAA+ superfamily ATPase
LKALEPDRYLNLADESQFLSYAKDPDRLRREIEAMARAGLVVIDEVQRVPRLLNTLQALMDDLPVKHRYLLSGSSARKLKAGGVNLLPGRIVVEHLPALTVFETGPDFDLDRALQVGMLPGVYLDPAGGIDLLGTYADTYLREEIRSEAVVREIGSYARFLDIMAVTSGQWLNYSKLSNDTEIPKETFRRFVEILEDTLLAIRLPAFVPRRKTTRRVAQRDRLLLFDVGVRNALVGGHRRPPGADQRGGLFEQWFILQVHALAQLARQGWVLSSYRTEGGAEVDLVVETDDRLYGIEIKSGRVVSVQDTRGLESLGEMIAGTKAFTRLVAYAGATRQRFPSGAEAWPWREVLEMFLNLK